jgi:2'-5' RNA ligase
VTRRLFFALLPGTEQSEELLARVAPLALQLRGQAVPAGNVHATLTFVGAVPEERVDDLRGAAAAVRGRPGEIVFDALDVWEDPRVLAATASGAVSAEAGTLAESLRAASISAGCVPDIKPFRPHLTLARKIDLAEARKSLWPQKLLPGFVVRFEKFALMESRRGEHGSIYSAVDSWHLYGADAS